MIYTSLSEYDADGPKITPLDGGQPLSIEGAQEEAERLEHRIDLVRAELDKMHDRATKRRLRARLDRYDAELTHIWGQLHPAWSDEDGYLSDTFNPGSLVPCRAASCSNQLTRHVAHKTLGFCPPCWAVATNPKQAQTA